jgi:predicted N-acyltransferase
VRERFRDRLIFLVAFQHGEPIAGTFNIAKGDALYGRYWGATRFVRHLHFNVCYYAAVDYCIEHGLSRFEPGAGGEYKQHRGFDAQPTYSAHFLSDERFAGAVEEFLERERADAEHSIAWIRENSALKPSPR